MKGKDETSKIGERLCGSPKDRNGDFCVFILL